MGRAGRSNIIYRDPPISCILVVTLELITPVLIQIHENKGSTKKRMNKEFRDLLFLVVLPTTCVHQQLEKSFEQPKDSLRIAEPCRDSCWYCDNWWIPPASKIAITKVLEHFARNNPTSMDASALPKLLFDKYNHVLWPQDHTKSYNIPSRGDKRDKKLRASAQWLVLALYLCNILSLDVEEIEKGKKIVKVSLVESDKNNIMDPYEWDHTDKHWQKMGY